MSSNGASPKVAEKEWIEFSDMNQSYYTFLLTSFSLTTSLISHPLTVIMVRQQAGASITGESHVGGGILSNIASTYRSLGMRGLFRGWLPLASMGMPSNVIYFNIVEITREYFQKVIRDAFPNVSDVAVDGMQSTCSSLIANFVSLIPYVPAELISSKLIVQKKLGMGMTAVSRSIYQERGVGGFFRGFSASFYVNCISGAQWWFAYSTCKRMGAHTEIGKEYPLAVDAISGLVSGLSAVLVSHPFDTIKTRIMTGYGIHSGNNNGGVSSGPTTIISPQHPQQHTSVQLFPSSGRGVQSASSYLQIFRHVLRNEGYRALYRGMPASLYQAAIGSTLFATSYEFIKTSSSGSSSRISLD